VYQQKASQCLSYASRLRVPVRDAAVEHTLRMESEEVNIFSDHYPSSLDREFEMVPIFGSHETRIRGSCHVYAPVTERIRQRRGDVLVQMKGNSHLSRCFFQRLLVQLRVQHRGVILAEFFDIRAVRPHLFLDLSDMIEVVREGCMDVRQGDRGDLRDDLVRSQSLVLIETDDVLHTDPVSRNARPSTTDPRSLSDSLVRAVVHTSLLAPKIGRQTDSRLHPAGNSRL
jgi:hypothetical protein